MKSRKKILLTVQGNGGTAILESSIFFMFIMTLLLVGSLLVDYFETGDKVERLITIALQDTGIRPLKIETNISAGTVRTSVRHQAIQDYLSNIYDTVTAKVFGLGDVEDYYLELAYAELQIDPQTGAPLGVSPTPFTFRLEGGGLSVPADIAQKVSLADAFSRYAQQSFSNGVSPYAVPTAVFNRGRGQNYLPTAVMVGMSLVIKIEGGTANTLERLIGLDPYSYGRKVIVLRGEVL
ncbi:MAG: hypothetical protein D6780_06715 [Candidatus Dadabacteria bacterium]|nr:MAG: hypothetical protein D6780_06715 [Candidatus Dadabacteria bacterium]